MGRAGGGNTADPERLARVLDVKKRSLGVDVGALDAQVAAKVAARDEAAAEARCAAATASATAGALAQAAAATAARRKEWDREVSAFRSTAQCKATTREWDLNAPHGLTAEAPARLGDDDPRCGVASLQRFAGEDLKRNERILAQQQECRADWDKQRAVLREAAGRDASDRAATAMAVRAQQAAQLAAANAEAAARATLSRQIAADNIILSKARAAQVIAQRKDAICAESAELAAAATDPWLGEDPSKAKSALSPLRVRTDHWKGMNAAQRDAVFDGQAAQLEAHRTTAVASAEAEAAAAEAQARASHARMQQAIAAEARCREQAVAAAAMLHKQAAEKAARDAAARKERVSAGVSDAYFAQFGTSHR